MSLFDYDEAFSRNIGWVTAPEQALLRAKRIAIAGMGGVGGGHLLTLARLGVGAFNLSDFDRFDIANFNRQAGAMMSTLGLPKVDTLRDMALDINPLLDVRLFPDGIDDHNLDTFLENVDLYVDSLDFFAFEARKKMFKACAQKGIPAITAAPLGMGTAFLAFVPGSMTFEEYFRMEGHDEFEQGLRFLMGLAPARLHMRYLVDPSRVRLDLKKGPSTIMACQLCAGIAATQALKILLKRGEVITAPYGLHFDAYANTLVRTYVPWGNNNPIQRLKLIIGRKLLGKKLAHAVPVKTADAPLRVIDKILDAARWAPSGDNTQVWRFEIVDEQHVIIHGFDTRDHVVYDVDGRPSQISLGALIENIHIAAGYFGLQISCTRRSTTTNETQPVFDVRLTPDPSIKPSKLYDYIKIRAVQRRPLHTRSLTADEKQSLEAAVGGQFKIQWLEGVGKRWRMAKLLFQNAKIRLTMPEAYQVHKSIIEWDVQFSEDRLPDQAVGLDPVGLKLMKWAMQSWQRVQFLNRYLAGTWLPRLQLDLAPGIACGAHFIISASVIPQTVDDYVEAGRALQRFWLTATQLGLQMQPEMTPLIFSWYVQQDRRFSTEDSLWPQAQRLRQRLADLIGEQSLQHAIFIGRIGAGQPATARSTRLPLSKLIYQPAQP
ncbi:ThiF family adenylyltransferase [Chitinivorax sp. B]|uniref:ThiF family adenylyltransferase n=1 Tax=Chitinivorax sp. B TaxID=2502235 RepID=UPI0010F798B4|nr:ThiF family adenylyltransferase [Chitinivorax sp. B]